HTCDPPQHLSSLVVYYAYGALSDLHSFPTRRSSDLRAAPRPRRRLVSSEPSSGVTTMRTTAARSSTRLMPISTRPCRECSSPREDRKSTRLNSSHVKISYAVFCLKKKK